MNFRPVHIGMIVFTALLFAACSASRNNLSPEDALRDRVQTYWDARVQGSAEKAYELLEPEAKKSTSLSSYAAKTGQSEILSYEIRSMDMDLAKKEAKVQVQRSFRIRPGVVPIKIDQVLEQTGNERWVLVDGQWYMSYAFPKFNFMKKPESKTN